MHSTKKARRRVPGSAGAWSTPGRASAACGALASLLLVSSTARAQAGTEPHGPPPPPAAAGTTSPAPTSPLTAHVKKKDEGAVYPKQALDEGYDEPVIVTLTLTVDVTGAVTRAVVDAPVGHGFDEAAVAASQKLVFDPATRDGKPVAAMIRFQYHFAPPLAVLSGRVVKAGVERPRAGATVVVRDTGGN